MKSEWEKMESMTNDELIIELIHARSLYRSLREIQKEDCALIQDDPKWAKEDPQEKTTHEWAEKIALYGAMHPKDGAFYSCDLMDYGLDGDQAYDICEELHDKGLLKVPTGIVCRDYEEEH